MLTARRAKDLLKAGYFPLYRLAMRAGLVIMPAHYYTSEPNILELAAQRDVWSEKLPLQGIHVDLDEQSRALRAACVPYQPEYVGNRVFQEAVSAGYGPGYGFVEAQVLHSLIRHLRPARVIEIGSGVSTAITVNAAKRNAQEGLRPTSITCIEPFPSDALRGLSERERNITLIHAPVQQTDIKLFTSLRENDILFVDSSHVVKAGSDVEHIVLRILPFLAKGVVVHFHDMYLPYAYQRDVLTTFIHNNETPFVVAFLTNNARFKILFSLSHLHYERPDVLREVFPEYVPQSAWRGLRENQEGHFPSSLWLTVTGAG